MSRSLGVRPLDLRWRIVRGLVWHVPATTSTDDLRRLSHHAMLSSKPAAAVLGGRDSVFVDSLSPFGDVVVKEFRRGGHVSRVVRYHHLRRGVSRGEREFRNLRAVRALGIRAPEPLAFGSRGVVFYRSWLVTRRVGAQGTLAALALTGANNLEAVVTETARQVTRLITSGVLHADLHPGNVIVDHDRVPWLLDFDRAFDCRGHEHTICERYVQRWDRAVRKHELPAMLSDVFRAEVERLAGACAGRLHGVATPTW